MIVRPRRSVLYVPASNARALARCRALDADGIVLDLEDAVAPADKAAAREAAARAVAEGGFGHREVVLRVNGLGTPWIDGDLALAAEARPDAVLLPKAAGPGDVAEAAARLAAAGASEGVRLWAMVETPAAALDVLALARAGAGPGARLDALVMGTNDLAVDLRARVGPGRAALLSFLSACVAAARACGLDALDGVFNGLDDPDGLAAEARQGRDLGFDGKTCIHPGQLAACNAAFSPAPEELAWARRLVEAFDAPGAAHSNVLRVDGRMVERLHAEGARRVLRLAAAVAARPGPAPSPAL